MMADYTAEQYREASQGYVGPRKITHSDAATEPVLSSVTTQELHEELARRKEAKKNEFRALVVEMYELGYGYEELDDLISEC